jgi:hypothetical protein
MNTTPELRPMTDDLSDDDLASGRWEPCHAFAPEVADSQVCGECGWLHDDHERDAVIRRLPVRVPSRAQLRRLAS